MMTLQQVLGWVGAAHLVGNGDVQLRRVHTDTRTLEAGDLFVALRGERFDANDFLAQARQQGGCCRHCTPGPVCCGPAWPGGS